MPGPFEIATPPPGAAEAVVLIVILLVFGVVADVSLLGRWRREGAPWDRWHARLNERPWRLREGLLLATLLAALHLGLVGLLAWIPSAGSGDDVALSPLAIIGQTIVFHGAAAVGIAVLLKRQRIAWRDAFGWRRARLGADIARGLLLYLALWPPLAAVTLLWNIGLSQAGYPVEPQDVISLLTDQGHPLWLQLYLSVVAVVVAPVVEELVFRGIALPILARRLSLGASVTIVSLLFAAIHLHLPAFLPLMVVGAAFALGYLATGSAVTPIVMHIAFNGVSLLLALKTRGMPDGG